MADAAADKLRSVSQKVAKGVGLLKDAGTDIFASLQNRYG
jgi:hypothetical protein